MFDNLFNKIKENFNAANSRTTNPVSQKLLLKTEEFDNTQRSERTDKTSQNQQGSLSTNNTLSEKERVVNYSINDLSKLVDNFQTSQSAKQFFNHLIG